MKLVSLNTWGGHVFEPLMSFVREHAPTTDIFCFQEMYTSSDARVSRGTRLDLFEELTAALPDHRGFFEPIQDNMDEEGSVDIPSMFGQAMFVRNSFLPLRKNGFAFTYRARNMLQGSDVATLGAGFQYAELMYDGKPFTVVNAYGTSRPGDKLDTPDRISQSEKMREFLDAVEGRLVMCGDLNLAPKTQSVRLLEERLRNLITEFNIQDTRGRLNMEKYPNDPTPQKFADYTFVSSDIDVRSFTVPDVSVSDHLPMILEFS